MMSIERPSFQGGSFARKASMAEMEDLTEFEEDEDTEYDDDCGVYLEDSCVHCQQLGSTNLLLEDKLRMLQSAMMQKEDRLKYLEETARRLETKALETELRCSDLRKEQTRLIEEIKDRESVIHKLSKENYELRVQIERTPESPPPPPPPPPPPSKPLSLFAIFKPNSGKKLRSKSMSRVDEFKRGNGKGSTPMVLNDDILDAIRNRRYSLRHVDKPLAGQERRRMYQSQYSINDSHLAKILERRMHMEYSDDDDDNVSRRTNFDDSDYENTFETYSLNIKQLTDKARFFSM